MRKKEKLLHLRYFDTTLLFLLIVIIIYGFLMIYSASYYITSNSSEYGYSAMKLFKSQILYTGIGFVFMFFVSLINYKIYKNFAWIGYITSIVLILLLKTPLGKTVKGATRWLKIGPIQFQVAEIVKIAMIIFLAYLISENCGKTKTIKDTAFLMSWPTLIALLVYKISNNMSTATIIFGIAAIMLFATHRKWQALVAIGICGCIFVGIYIHGVYIEEMTYNKQQEALEETDSKITDTNDSDEEGFRSGRIRAWLNPERYSEEKSYQSLQAQYAIGFGGLTGKGLGNSIQKKTRIPEPYNDMIFAVICEELGFIGGTLVIILFFLLLLRLYLIMQKTKDPFGHMIMLGIFSHIALQVMLNIAVATGAFPTTGVTLPFFSYGGTASIFLLGEIGLALSIDKVNKERGEKIIYIEK